jgi:hypothetical protein
LVRLRVKKAAEEIARTFTTIGAQGDRAVGEELAQITDEDIENLFSA